MPVEDELARFYEEAYSMESGKGDLYGRWRALGAIGKATHVEALCEQAGLRPRRVVEIGCGDGALLAELSHRGLGEMLRGFEISRAAAAIAAQRPEILAAEVFDGARIPAAAGEQDLAILSHVMEHVPDPASLLAEAARVAPAVILEVPLEDNLSARRSSKRVHAAEVGHLQRFSRDQVRAVVAQAGLTVRAELEDPLPLEALRFFAPTRSARARATLKWLLRSLLWRLSRPLARRLFTVHYACLAVAPDPAPGPPRPVRQPASALESEAPDG